MHRQTAIESRIRDSTGGRIPKKPLLDRGFPFSKGSEQQAGPQEQAHHPVLAAQHGGGNDCQHLIGHVDGGFVAVAGQQEKYHKANERQHQGGQTDIADQQNSQLLEKTHTAGRPSTNKSYLMNT